MPYPLMLGADPAPADAPFATIMNTYDSRPSWWKALSAALRTASFAASVYHGAKRHGGSIGWGLGWGVLGALFPVVTPAIGVAQGFGQCKYNCTGVRGLRGRHPQRRLGR